MLRSRKETDEWKVEGSLLFTAEAYDEYGNPVKAEIIWSVKGDIGRISTTGEFIADAPGTGSVIASAGTVYAEAVVYVIR